MTQLLNNSGCTVVKAVEFINSMDEAYAAADLIVSRAGALSISELCLIGKPVILVPSPNVVDDHQTKNAMSLVKKSAAIMVPDRDASAQLIPAIMSLLADTELQQKLSANILALGRPDATNQIVNEIEKLVEYQKQ